MGDSIVERIEKHDLALRPTAMPFIMPFLDYINHVLIPEINEGKIHANENNADFTPSHLRSTISRLVHAFEHSGVTEKSIFGRKIKTFGMQNDPYSSDNSNALYGQEFSVYKLYKAFEGLPAGRNQNRVFSIVGMKGTGKSNLLNLIKDAYLAYSNIKDNLRYITEIRIPHDIARTSKGSILDFSSNDRDGFHNDNDYASFQCNDSPILLIPREIRKEYLQKLGVDIKAIPPFYLDGDMCSRCEELQDLFFTYFQRNPPRVLLDDGSQETFFQLFSENLWAAKHRLRDGKEIALFQDNTLKSPDLLRFELQQEHSGGVRRRLYPLNEMPLAISELLLFDDLGAFVEYWKDIRSIVSSGVYKPFENIWINKDTVIIVATNEEIDSHEFFKKDAGLTDRIIKVALPAITRYGAEIQVYNGKINILKTQGYDFDPNVVKLAVMLAVTQRVTPPRLDSIKHILKKEELRKEETLAVTNLTALEKIVLYNRDDDTCNGEDFDIFSHLNDREIFTNALLGAIHEDYYNVDALSLMEGFKGPSVRALQDLWPQLADFSSMRRAQIQDKRAVMGFDLLDFLYNFPTNLTAKWTGNWNKKSGNNDTEKKGYDMPNVSVNKLEVFYETLLKRQVLLSTVDLTEQIVGSIVERYLGLLTEWSEKGKEPNIRTARREYFELGKPVIIDEALFITERKNFGAINEQGDPKRQSLEFRTTEVLNRATRYGDDAINGVRPFLRTKIKDAIVDERSNKEYNTMFVNMKRFIGECLGDEVSVNSYVNGNGRTRTVGDQENIELFCKTFNNMVKIFGYSEVTAILALDHYIDRRLKGINY